MSKGKNMAFVVCCHIFWLTCVGSAEVGCKTKIPSCLGNSRPTILIVFACVLIFVSFLISVYESVCFFGQQQQLIFFYFFSFYRFKYMDILVEISIFIYVLSLIEFINVFFTMWKWDNVNLMSTEPKNKISQFYWYIVSLVSCQPRVFSKKNLPKEILRPFWIPKSVPLPPNFTEIFLDRRWTRKYLTI